MTYARFKNRDHECFGCSLANYFDLISESELAEKVHSSFREHNLVAEDGSMVGLLCTRLVTELTRGTYRGVLKYNSFASIEEALRNGIGDRTPEALKIIEEEKMEGRLIGDLRDFNYTGQALLIQAIPGYKYSHWLVDSDDGSVINNGEIRLITDSNKFFSTILGVLKIYRI